ncbi:MAG: hypothetical protein LQ343_004982 [Gyalolechia ehrenbergii]|nr:MAG: hypothetical protein LQ343_004982 [Gyalolechia ehrenbergii]
MHLLYLLPFALLTHATPDLFPRQNPPLNGSTLTSAPALSSAAAQLISQYFPSSLLPGLAIAIESAASSASITGNINSIVSSALTASTPPPFLTALPTQYQSRLSVIESSLSMIRSEASAATVIPTSTLMNNGTGNATVVSTITSMGSTLTTSLVATVVNGSTSVVVSGNGTMVGTGGMTSSAEPTGAEGSSAGGAPAPTSSGLAAATRVPLAAAAAGVMGLVGMVVVL